MYLHLKSSSIAYYLIVNISKYLINMRGKVCLLIFGTMLRTRMPYKQNFLNFYVAKYTHRDYAKAEDKTFQN